MPSLLDANTRERLLVRLYRLTPDARPKWGRMTVERMLAHLSDSLRIAFGEIDAGPFKPGFLSTRFGRWLAIDSPLPWGHSRILAAPAFFTTEPTGFNADRDRLRTLIERFWRAEPCARWGVSSAFGPLSAEQWARLCYRHCDHHLRQFGV